MTNQIFKKLLKKLLKAQILCKFDENTESDV